MKAFDQCPICGGELVEKRVEKLLRGGVNLAVVSVNAQVCLRCGERFYAEETVRSFEELRRKLARGETQDFQPLGRSFKWFDEEIALIEIGLPTDNKADKRKSG